MGAPGVTWSFTNGTTSDATQVNTNFTDHTNDMSDGTTDFSIGTLAVAGNTTLNGNVTLGNASADDITITGNIAASITFKNNATYNIGTSTAAPLSIYLGNGTKSTRIIAGTIGTSWTFTLPNDVPAITGQTMIFNTSGTAEFRYYDKFTASKTADYTATGDETIIPCAPATTMTVTLPAASTMTGKSLTIIKTNSDITKTVTIDANASETIIPSVQSGQLTYILYTQNEAVTIKCDGSNWYVVAHFAQTDWVDSGATTIGATTTGPTKQTTRELDALLWRRNGRHLEYFFKYQAAAAAGGANGSGDYLFTICPSGATVDTALYGVYTTVGTPFLYNSVTGNGQVSSNGSSYIITNSLYSTTQIRGTFHNAGLSGVMSSGNSFFNSANLGILFVGSVPISGWNP